MSAAAGNRYAEKWTRERTMRALEYIQSFANQEDCVYLGTALHRAGYYEDIWRYWRKKWARDHDITYLIKMILQAFESRIVERVSNGKMPVRFAMFALGHHYGWGKERANNDDLAYLAEADRAAPAQVSPTEDRRTNEGSAQTSPEVSTAACRAEDAYSDADTSLPETAAENDGQKEILEMAAPAIEAQYEPGWYHKPRMTHALRDYYAHKITCYNMEHPESEIKELMAYHDGPVPEGMTGIAWDGGHFRQWEAA